MVEVDGVRVVCRIGGGPGRTMVRLGVPDNHAGRRVMLALPAADRAWEALRAWRAERSKSLGVPAYVVFDDATLRLVAAHLPGTEAGLLALRGIGPAKTETYGTELLEISDRFRTG